MTAVTNILLVDDREENLVALEAILEPLGQRLVAVTSGTAALKELLLGDFACILLDVQMPELDGFELASLIKQRDRSQHIPIIFLTALSKDERHVFRGYDVGAVDYIFKPIEPDILRSKVSVFVELAQKNRQLQEQAEQLRRQELAQQERESEQRYRNLADAMPQIVWRAETEGGATYFNRRWFEFTGLHEDDADPHAWHRIVHPDDLPIAVARREQSLWNGEPFETEYRFRHRDGTYRWFLGRAVPIRDETGRVEYWVGTATDIHDRKIVEEQRSLLVATGDELSASLDYRETLTRVADLAVRSIADWVSVHVVEGDGTISEVTVAHADPAQVAFAREVQERYPGPADGPTGAPAVIRTGEPELVPEVTPELIELAAEDELHADLLRQLGIVSYMCVPIAGRARVLGAITFVSSDPGRLYEHEDLLIAQEIAQRAATAIENAQLYGQAEERAQASRVLATIGDGVVLVGRSGRVRLWNPAAERITGVSETEMVGRLIDDAIPGWSGVAPRVPVAQPGEPVRPETLPLELGERETWLSISAVGFEDGTVYAFRDLTEQRALETMRQDLVATVSHELRTPLAAIYGAALTLQRDDVEFAPELHGRLLEVISDEAAKLAEIVNDLLLASQLDSGRLKVEIERCDPAEIARLELESARAHLPENVDLVLAAADDLPDVAADPGQLRQVLSNLIDNAIKYSPNGGTVRVGVEPRDHHVRFSVADSGLGIPPAEQQRIFEKFYRLDPGMSRGIGGTGLGLYICRELVRRVDGRIWVESTAGRGSTFFIELPREQMPAEVLAHRR